MIRITLGNEHVPHIEYEKDGQKRSFHVDHNTLFEFIQRNCYETKTVKKGYDTPVFETPALPPGTVKYLALPDGRVVLFMEKKEASHDINYHGTIYKAVPFPNLLFVFLFEPSKNGYRLVNKHCYAHRNHVLRDDTPLYRFPFSHVDASGTMCFFFLNEMKDLAQMTSFIHNWITATFTDHYYNTTDKNKWGWPLRQIFNQTQGKPHFDYDKLFEENLTMKDLVKRYTLFYFPPKSEGNDVA